MITVKQLAQALSEAFETDDWGDVDPYLFKEVVDPVADSDHAADVTALRSTLQRAVDKLKRMAQLSAAEQSAMAMRSVSVRVLDRGRQGKLGIVTSRGRVFACTWSPDTQLTEEDVFRTWRLSRSDFKPFDESRGCYIGGGRS